MIAGATFAWFTDSDKAGNVVFAAGTVSIEAGNYAILSQYFNPDEAVYVYAVEENTGDLYEVDVKNGLAHMIFDTPMDELSPADQYSPNGLAFDNVNRRLYFSIKKSGSTHLWFYDFNEKDLVFSGALNNKTIYGAAFWDGYYWYINNGTDDLFKVSFDSSGLIAQNDFVDDITDNEKRFNFGDIVIEIKDGILYGSSALSSSDPEFFTYDIMTQEYTMITDRGNSVGLQLAFGSDNKLYGHLTNSGKDGKWYIIDPADGSSTEIIVAGGRNFNDIASAYKSVWNPGDSEKMKYYVTNTGTKNIFLRAKLEGKWNDESLSSNVVGISLCQESINAGWEEHSDGYFYYKTYFLPPGETVELCVEVRLEGPGTGNEYQGKTFVLSGMMYAIQSSNGAIFDEWLGGP